MASSNLPRGSLDLCLFTLNSLQTRGAADYLWILVTCYSFSFYAYTTLAQPDPLPNETLTKVFIYCIRNVLLFCKSLSLVHNMTVDFRYVRFISFRFLRNVDRLKKWFTIQRPRRSTTVLKYCNRAYSPRPVCLSCRCFGNALGKKESYFTTPFASAEEVTEKQTVQFQKRMGSLYF